MVKVLRSWYIRYFSDPEAVLLLLVLIGGFSLVIFFSDILTPVLASIVIAYILQWVVNILDKKIPHKYSYLTVYFAFLAIFIVGTLVLLPLIWRQMLDLITALPSMVQKAKDIALTFVAKSHFLSKTQVDAVTVAVLGDVQVWGKKILTTSVSSIPGIIVWFIYLILVPLLVFFLLKDQEKISAWAVSLLPQKHSVLKKVCLEVDEQIGNYIRGKILEITIVGIVTYLAFLYFGLRYQVLLAVLVGLSVLVPYIGVVVVTIPIIFVGYLQWGFSSELGYLLLVHLLIQGLDGNIIVPLLFSEAVNLHPIAIILAVLFFGGIWGFWGVFFAIPLATLVKALAYAWPTRQLKSKAK